jgi:hypothetical protein
VERILSCPSCHVTSSPPPAGSRVLTSKQGMSSQRWPQMHWHNQHGARRGSCDCVRVLPAGELLEVALGCSTEAQACASSCTPPNTTLVLYCTVLYCTVLYCTVLYCTVLYCTVLYCTVLYPCTECTALYCTVLPAGELLEVAVGCGAEAQASAVDLILGKGVVRPLAAEDEPIIRCVRVAGCMRVWG